MVRGVIDCAHSPPYQVTWYGRGLLARSRSSEQLKCIQERRMRLACKKWTRLDLGIHSRSLILGCSGDHRRCTGSRFKNSVCLVFFGSTMVLIDKDPTSGVSVPGAGCDISCHKTRRSTLCSTDFPLNCTSNIMSAGLELAAT
jgi:hypothetical protein